jgi:hypothetical protein
VNIYISIVMGSSTTYGSDGWILSLPTDATILNGVALASTINIAGTYYIGAGANGSDVTNIYPLGINSSGTTARCSSSTPASWGTGSVLIISGTYECT